LSEDTDKQQAREALAKSMKAALKEAGVVAGDETVLKVISSMEKDPKAQSYLCACGGCNAHCQV
jgi:hypothetical protein